MHSSSKDSGNRGGKVSQKPTSSLRSTEVSHGANETHLSPEILEMQSRIRAAKRQPGQPTKGLTTSDETLSERLRRAQKQDVKKVSLLSKANEHTMSSVKRMEQACAAPCPEVEDVVDDLADVAMADDWEIVDRPNMETSAMQK